MEAALFDLDNTLYDSQQYFLGAFADVSKYISAKHDVPEGAVYEALVKLWKEKTSIYPYLFNDLLELLHLGQDCLPTVVKTFNEYAGTIEPYPDAIPTLHVLKETRVRLGIVTDGNVERQKRKIRLLGLSPLFDVIIYAQEVAPKPSPAPFLAALERLNVRAVDAFYIADNPLIDFKGAKEAGMKTIRVLQGEFAVIPRDEHIDFEIAKLGELVEITGVKA
jgi:putative hydrolase of the HAD superfamily